MTGKPDGKDTAESAAARWRSIVAGVILAGGLSRRMGGGDKALMDLGDRSMLAHVRDRLAPQVGGLALNANGDPARFAEFDLPVIADPIDGFIGPLAGVLAGMRWAQTAQPGARWVVTAATDTPFLPTDLVDRLVVAAGHNETMIALAKSGDQVHPVFGLWPVCLADDLDEWLSAGHSNKVLHWVDRHPRVDVSFTGPVVDGIMLDPFFNANTPDDMATATAILEELSG